MLLFQGYLFVQVHMLFCRVALITRGAEQHHVPKLIHYGQVAAPVVAYGLIEDEANGFILPYFIIKAVYQKLYILPVGYVLVN